MNPSEYNPEYNPYYLLQYRRPVPVDGTTFTRRCNWAKQYERMRPRVRLTQTKGHWVSTVFLGIDHGEEETPILFETMIRFKDDFIDYQTCCSTWREALAMHWAGVAYIKELNQ